MAIQGAAQGLIAAFAFGNVVNAASAALFLYLRGHGTAAFRDSLRLALTMFLASAALWAHIDFAAVLVDVSSSSVPCQVAVALATVFDQLARFSIEQYLVWAIGSGTTASAGQMMLQILVFARFVVGAVFAGLARPQTDSFCVAASSSTSVAVAVVALDGITLALLLWRAVATGLVKDMRQGKTDASRNKAVLLVLGADLVWTATSVTMLLGSGSSALMARTAIPAAGLTILLIIVTGGVQSLATSRSGGVDLGDAGPRRRTLTSQDRPESTTGPAAADYPPLRYEDVKDATARSATAFVKSRDAPRTKELTKGAEGRAYAVRPGTATTQDLVAPNPKRRQDAPTKRTIFGTGTAPVANISVGRRAIGPPILQDNGSHNPLNKMSTIELGQAVQMDKERRVRPRAAPQPAADGADDVQRAAIPNSTRPGGWPRKEIKSMPMPSTRAASSSAQLSPGADEVRRRSPRPPSPPASPEPASPAPRPRTADPGAGGLAQTVLFVGKIEYKDPMAVQSIIDDASQKLVSFGLPPDTPATSGSIMDRPRPIPKTGYSAGFHGHRRRSKSLGSLLMIRQSASTSSAPSSPTRPPPLHRLTSGAPRPRIQASSAACMTVDELIDTMFPMFANLAHSTATIPAVPALPAVFQTTPSPSASVASRTRSHRIGSTWSQTETNDSKTPRTVPRGEASLPSSAARRASSSVLAASARASMWTESTEDDRSTIPWTPEAMPKERVGILVTSHSNSAEASLRPQQQLSRPFLGPPGESVRSACQDRSQRWWHHFGDPLPSFSDRKTGTVSRKMPAPPPLVLDNMPKQALIVQPASLSPLESPVAAAVGQADPWRTSQHMERASTAQARPPSLAPLEVSATMMLLASPTPPSSKHADHGHDRTDKASQPTYLWETAFTDRKSRESGMWEHKAKCGRETTVGLPGLPVRPWRRKEIKPLAITSSRLWRRSISQDHHAGNGLWQPSPVPPAESLPPLWTSTGSSRPAVQRPLRRPRRLTLLPDIVEDPQPLPDKRGTLGTLGLFQFPWGEMSDTASVQAHMSTAMPGPMAPTAGASQDHSAAESAEASVSFFDDYDDDDEGDDDSDDDFDESTLWEMTMLTMDGPPGKSSLLPPPMTEQERGWLMDAAEQGGLSGAERQSTVLGPLAETKSQTRNEARLEVAQPAVQRGEHDKQRPHAEGEDWDRHTVEVETASTKPLERWHPFAPGAVQLRSPGTDQGLPPHEQDRQVEDSGIVKPVASPVSFGSLAVGSCPEEEMHSDMGSYVSRQPKRVTRRHTAATEDGPDVPPLPTIQTRIQVESSVVTELPLLQPKTYTPGSVAPRLRAQLDDPER